MESRRVTAKLSTPTPTPPPPAQPALRARTRRILDPSSSSSTAPIANTSPVPRPAVTRATSARDASSLDGLGLAPRRAIVRASTSVVVGGGGGKVQGGSGSELGARPRVSSPVSRSDGGMRAAVTRTGPAGRTPTATATATATVKVATVSARRERPAIASSPVPSAPQATTAAAAAASTIPKQDSTPRIPLGPSRVETPRPNPLQTDLSRSTTYFDPTSPRAVTSLRREEHPAHVPLVSPRSGRREAGRKARAAVEAVAMSHEQNDDDDDDDDDRISDTGSSDSESASSAISSRSTGSEAEEEPPPLPPLIISAEIRRQILDEEDAKRSRKIADLEISNTSLMSINRTLEADVARLNRMITAMKRQLRASGHLLPPRHASDSDSEASSSSSSSTSTSSHKSAPVTRRASIDAALETSNAHTDALRAMNEQLERLVVRGKAAVARVEGMTEGGKGKVLSGWEVGEGEESGEGSRSDDPGEGDERGDEGGHDGDGAVD